MNRYALGMGTVIAACSASVILLILKCYSVPIEWPWVFVPVLIVAGVWFVVFLACIAIAVLNDVLSEWAGKDGID